MKAIFFTIVLFAMSANLWAGEFEDGVRYGILAYRNNPTNDSFDYHTEKAREIYDALNANKPEFTRNGSGPDSCIQFYSDDKDGLLKE